MKPPFQLPVQLTPTFPFLIAGSVLIAGNGQILASLATPATAADAAYIVWAVNNAHSMHTALKFVKGSLPELQPDDEDNDVDPDIYAVIDAILKGAEK